MVYQCLTLLMVAVAKTGLLTHFPLHNQAQDTFQNSPGISPPWELLRIKQLLYAVLSVSHFLQLLLIRLSCYSKAPLSRQMLTPLEPALLDCLKKPLKITKMIFNFFLLLHIKGPGVFVLLMNLQRN